MPPVPSKREAIIEAMRARLEVITTANGFHTDIGATLLVNELPLFGDGDPTQAMSLLVLEDEITWQGKAFLVRLPLSVLVLVDAEAVGGTTDAWRLVEQAIADIKRAVELEDPTFDGVLSGTGLERGTVEPMPREPGTSTMAGAVSYIAAFKEGWGNP